MIELASVRGGQMIFNMGGGVKPPEVKPTPFGKYAWRKYAVGEKLEEKISTIRSKHVVDSDPENYTVYASGNMQRDDVTGLYTLVSPSTWTLTPDGNGLTMTANHYIMFGSPTGNVVFKNTQYVDYRAVVRATSSEGVLIVPSDVSYPVTKYSFEMVPDYILEEIVVSDDPEEYPNGEQDGFIYERMNVNKGLIELDNFDDLGIARKVTFNIPDAYSEQDSLFAQSSSDSVYKMHISNADEVIIRSKKITQYMFAFLFYNFSGKLKIFTEQIETRPFEYLGFQNGTPTVTNRKIFISKDVKSIDSITTFTQGLFYNGSAQYLIYCEAESKPDEWGQYWNYRASNAPMTVYWGVTEEEFDAL